MWTTTTTTTVLLTLLLLLLLLTFISTENFTLTIVHTGRTDTKFQQRRGRYGIARAIHWKMKQNGANIIILIAHDRRAPGRQVIKRIQDLVDVVVGGHGTGFYYNGVPPTASLNYRGPYPAIYEDEKAGRVLVEVRCGQDLNYVGKLQVTFDEGGDVVNASGNCFHMDGDIPEDSNAKEMLEEYSKKVKLEEEKVVGNVRIPMPLHCVWRECNLGNFITDAFVWFQIRHPATGTKGWTNAAIAIINTGALRTGILLNPYQNNTVRDMDITSALPWETPLVVVNMKRRVLKKALEHSVDTTKLEIRNNKFLQVSGIKVVYDMSKDRLHRVVALRARCRDCDTPRYEDVKDHHNYYVVMSEYLRFGGDKYYMFTNESSVVDMGNMISDTAALRDHVKKVKMLQTGEEQRIRIENCPRCGANVENEE